MAGVQARSATGTLTPYAVLSIPPRCTDEDVRARYYDRIRCQHPDMRKDHAPGPQWAALTAAYKAIHTQAERDRWYAGHRLLSGL
jgi:DnaJ-class molecular chaperone